MGRWMASAAAPSAAPITVPKLKKAWNTGMIDRPSTRSFTAPCRFIATSQIENIEPNTINPIMTTA